MYQFSIPNGPHPSIYLLIHFIYLCSHSSSRISNSLLCLWMGPKCVPTDKEKEKSGIYIERDTQKRRNHRSNHCLCNKKGIMWFGMEDLRFLEKVKVELMCPLRSFLLFIVCVTSQAKTIQLSSWNHFRFPFSPYCHVMLLAA